MQWDLPQVAPGNEDFSNPLDPQNLRTAGAPIGLELLPGDEQVTVSWEDTGHEGIMGYRIYRRFTGDVDSTFEFFGEILGENGARPATEFIDTEDLKNDQFDEANGAPHRYIYRISYIDANGIEVPDPNAHHQLRTKNRTELGKQPAQRRVLPHPYLTSLLAMKWKI